MNIRTIVLDMDGVLISAKEIHYNALNKALETVGIPVITREEHLSIYDGLPTDKKAPAGTT